MDDWTRVFGVHLHRRRLEILRGLLSGERFSSVLDVGCGNGLLASLGLARAIGIDIKLARGVTVLASAEYLPFKPDSFDLVVAGEVIEHLEKPAKALREWTEVLKAGGTLVVSTPNGNLVRPNWTPEHKRTYAPQDIKRALERIGLRVTSAKGTFTGLFSGRRLFKWLPSDLAKMLLLRMPVPLSVTYDFFIKATKEPRNVGHAL